MPYAATVTVRLVGPGSWLVQIDEVDCGPTDEAQIGSLVDQGLPVLGKVLRQQCVLLSGSAATVNAILGEVANPPANLDRIIVENNPAIQPIPTVNDTQGIATYYDLTPAAGTVWGIAFHRSRPDVGADNVIRSYYHVVANW